MASVNKKKQNSIFTHEGVKAKHITSEQALGRSVLSCLLFEKEFYEAGENIASRIARLIPKCSPQFVADLAVTACHNMKLRHAPLLIVREMSRINTHKHLVADTLAEIINRPDSISEFVALYWLNGKQPLSGQVKKGLARAFNKFNEYQFAKWSRDRDVSIRDVMFLCHPKAKDKEQQVIFDKIVNGTLATPDTWEVNLSAKGADKNKVWTKMLSDGTLGGMALLRNLRNMQQAGVDIHAVGTAIERMKTDYILPYRFIAAANFAPALENELEQAMFRCLDGQDKLRGQNALLVDVSGSMDQRLSSKSDLSRLDAACGLAMLLREVCPELRIFTFSKQLVEIGASRRGFALRDAIIKSQDHNATYLGASVKCMYTNETFKVKGHWHGTLTFKGVNVQPERLMVITDEQSNDPVPDPDSRTAGYMINVASNKNGVGYGPWRHIDGFSEAVIDWLRMYEQECS